MVAQVIRDGALIDGNGGEPIANGTILVEDGRINAVDKDGSFAAPDCAIELDAGVTILPGLIDTHVHIMMEEVNINKPPSTSFSLNFHQAIEYRRRTLDTDVTTMRDVGGADLIKGCSTGRVGNPTACPKFTCVHARGMSPMESIVASTKVAAECLGWQDRIGTLEVGKFASVVITRTNPLADIRSLEQLTNITKVIKGGELVKDIQAA